MHAQKNDRRTSGLAQLGPTVEAIEVTGGLDNAIGFAQRETTQALAALETWPDSPHSRALAALARFAQDRTN
jgi:geranylgeranyl pyrophosphate synthase